MKNVKVYDDDWLKIVKLRAEGKLKRQADVIRKLLK